MRAKDDLAEQGQIDGIMNAEIYDVIEAGNPHPRRVLCHLLDIGPSIGCQALDLAGIGMPHRGQDLHRALIDVGRSVRLWKVLEPEDRSAEVAVGRDPVRSHNEKRVTVLGPQVQCQ